MPHARSKMPMWRRQNLTLHRKKHASCFADIHQVPLATISDGKFEIYSNDCFEKPMLSYTRTRRLVNMSVFAIISSIASWALQRLPVTRGISSRSIMSTLTVPMVNVRRGLLPKVSGSSSMSRRSNATLIPGSFATLSGWDNV